MPLPQFSSEEQFVSFVISAQLPEWQKKLFKKYAEAVQVHSRGEIFYKIDRLFPNEHPESKEHRILSFESITEASFGRAANNVNRIFKNSSYSVEASDKVIAETTANGYHGTNFYSWFLDEWVKVALKNDPNSRIVVYPPSYTKETGRPPVVFVDSCHLKFLTEDSLIFVSEIESYVDYELKELCVTSETFYDQSINKWNAREAAKNTYTPKLEATVKRPVYHCFFKGVGFYRIEQLDKAGQEANGGGQYSLEFFPFEQDFLPCIDAGGEKGKNEVNKSFLHPFVSFGNLALLQHSQHTAVNFTFSFPRMSEIQGPCDVEGCNGGHITCESEADIAAFGDKKPCRKCGGTGFTRNQTPYKVYVKQHDPQLQEDTKHLEVDDVKYYSPDVAILDYSKDEWKNYLEMAEMAVYVNQRVSTGNVESAKSKEIDREDMYSFLFKVGQCYFNRLRFVLQAFENYNSTSPMQVSVETPYSYAILSEGEAFVALKDILSSTVPVMLKASQVESFISKFVSQASPIRKFLEVLKIVDPLLYYTGQEIAGFKASNIVTPDQYSVHVFAFPTLQNMFIADNNLFEQDMTKIVDDLKKLLLEFKPPKEKTLRETLIDQGEE
jgi:hypothetical protein